jgi:hypothetical protein
VLINIREPIALDQSSPPRRSLVMSRSPGSIRRERYLCECSRRHQSLVAIVAARVKLGWGPRELLCWLRRRRRLNDDGFRGRRRISILIVLASKAHFHLNDNFRRLTELANFPKFLRLQNYQAEITDYASASLAPAPCCAVTLVDTAPSLQHRIVLH